MNWFELKGLLSSGQRLVLMILCLVCLGKRSLTFRLHRPPPFNHIGQTHMGSSPWSAARTVHMPAKVSKLQSVTFILQTLTLHAYPLLAMYSCCTALRGLQRIAVAPLSITKGAVGKVQREMSSLPRVYVTRQIPPEGLKILRESGQWVTKMSCSSQTYSIAAPEMDFNLMHVVWNVFFVKFI